MVNGIEKEGEILADSNCQLIESMIESDLTVIESSEDGWTKRFKGKDGKICELTYPESYIHGGGPPKLVQIEK